MARLDELIDEGSRVRRAGDEGFYAATENLVPWRAAAIAYLERVLGRDDAYTRQFADAANTYHYEGVTSGVGILTNLRHDLAHGYLRRMSQLVAAELVADIWEQASVLLNEGYKDAAASIAGAALEVGLRRIALAHNVDVTGIRNLGPLNTALATAGVYSAVRQRQVDAWKELRNAAAHGDYSSYAEADVRTMLTGVQAFLAEFL